MAAPDRVEALLPGRVWSDFDHAALEVRAVPRWLEMKAGPED